MSVASRITSMSEHIQNAYDSIERFGVDTENIDKNLVNLSNTITNEIYDKLPKVSGNGSNFTLESVQNGKLDLFEMEGNTEQDSYSGKNKYGITSAVGYTYSNSFPNTTSNAIVIDNYDLNNISFHIIGTPYLLVLLPTFELQPNTDYIISYKRTNVLTDSTTARRFIYALNSNDEYSMINALNSEDNGDMVYQFKTKETGKIAIAFGFNNNSKGSSSTVNNLMIRLATESDDSFEPYVGGTASPNPDYPQDVKVVENKQVVNVSEKNLCSSTELQSARNIRFYIDKKIEKTLTISFTTNESLNNNSLYLSATDTLVTTITANANTKATATFTLSDEQYSAIQNATNPYFLLFKSGANFTVPNDAQIENGSIATTYEPYHNKDYEIDLGDIELCKIGDYKDIIFKNNQLSEYYDSTLDEDSWYIKKSIGKVVLDGSESWTTIQAYGKNYYAVTISDILVSDSGNNDALLFSNYYIGYKSNELVSNTTKDYGICRRNNQTQVLVRDKDTNTLEVLKTWLSTHNTEIIYPLATPTYEKITNATLITQLEAIETETGTNIFEVSNENNVLPSLNVKRLKELEKLS